MHNRKPDPGVSLLVKGDNLHHHNVNYFRKSNDQWCLDTLYPYMGRAPYKIEMEDTPSSELGKLTKECHVQNDFLTYLMFIPSSNPEDENAVWVPLRLIKWEWAAGVRKGENMPRDAPCNKKTFKPIYEVPPRVKGKENSSVHPEWSCNIRDNKEEVIGWQGYHDENWKRLTAERERRWGGKR